MSKKVRTIIIGSAVLVALIGVLVVLQLTKEKPKENSVSNIDDEFVTLVNGKEADLEYVHIKNQKDDYIINRQAEERWGIKEIMDYEQTYYLYTETVPMACNIVASSIVEENSKDLSIYGLVNPEVTVKVKFKDKDEKSVSLGNLSPDGKVRYGIETGEKTVYAFPNTAFKNFYFTKYDYVNKELIKGFDPEQPNEIPIINEMIVSRPDLEKPIILKKFQEGELSKNATSQSYIYMQSPVKSLISESAAQDYVFGNFGIMAEKIVSAKPTKEQLAEYGFDKPTSEFTVRYNDTTTLKIITGKGIECEHNPDEKLDGHKHEIVSYYAKKENSDQIFVVKATDMRWMGLQPKDIISSVAVLESILDINSIDITLEGTTNNLTFVRGEDPKDVNQFKSTLNKKEVDIAKAKAYMQLCQLTSIQDVNKKQVNANPTATIKYNYTSGKSDVIDIYILEDRTCVLSVNGNKAFIGRPGYVDKLIKEMQNLTSGKEVDIDW